MNGNDSGGVLGGLVLWAVIGGIGYAFYNHFHELEVHSKTIVAAKVKNFGVERVYDEKGHLERNQIGATFNVPIGPVSVKKKLSVEETTPIRKTIPFTDDDRVRFNTSTIVSSNSEPFRYSRVYDQSGVLTGQGLNTDLFGYSREYWKSGKLKSEALSAGFNVNIGPVEVQCRRIWTFTKPAPKKYLPLDNWRTRNISSNAALNKEFTATNLQTFLKTLDKKPTSHFLNPKENKKSQILDNHLTNPPPLSSAELQAILRQWNKKKTMKFVKRP